jgi:AraC-like DNA-binding protein
MMTLATSSLRPPLRFAQWCNYVEDAFGPLRIETNARALQHAVVRRLALGPVELVVCDSPPLRMTRLCSGGADDPLAHYLGLEVVCSGRSTLVLDGREVRMNAGDLVLHHPGASYSAETTEAAVIAVLLIPMERYVSHFDKIRHRLNCLLPVTDPGASILSATLRATAESIRGEMPAHQCDRLANALLELVDMVFLGESLASTDTPPRHSLFRQAVEYIEQTLPNPELSVRSVSKYLHVSVRTVHDIFHRHGCAPSRFILLRRLERSAAYLRGPGADRIADIAQAVGFDDPAYFSRTFHRHFGISPLRFRRRFEAGFERPTDGACAP